MSSVDPPPVRSRQHRIDACINASPRARLWNTRSYLSILLVGVPFWWHTTTIERRPLPTGQVEGMDFSHADQGSIPVTFSVSPEIIPSPQDRAAFANWTIDACETYCQANELDCERFAWNLPDRSKEENALHIRFEPLKDGRRSYISPSGAHAGDLLIGIPEHTSIALPPADLPAQVYKALSTLIPSKPPSRPARAIKYSKKVNLAFSLLNEDSTLGGGAGNWDIERAIAETIDPFLAPLRDLYEFSIETQIVFHAPLKSAPVQTAEGWTVTKEHMKTFVNNEQWTLDSGSSNDPVLRFLLFIPSARHSPLKLDTSDDSPAFLIPQIGGVVIHQDPASEHADISQGVPAARRLEMVDLKLPFTYFASQLYALLGIPPLRPEYAAEEKGIRPMTRWQKINLMRSITESNLMDAKGTLISITRLVARIKEMVINSEVRADVHGAVNALQKLAVAIPASSAGLQDLFDSAQDAADLANKAFFNPSMMGLLYFPDEHKYAVYTPLFAPVAVPVLVALLKEAKGWRERRRRTT